MQTAIDIEKGRTSGDGMEQEILTKVDQEQTNTPAIKANSLIGRKKSIVIGHTNTNHHASSNKPLPGLHSLYRRPEHASRSLAPVIPKGELVPLKPRLVASTNNLPEHKRNKQPKFVPMEPYPGAVNHIVPTSKLLAGRKINKNNLDIAVLASQVSLLATQELDDTAPPKPVEHEERVLQLHLQLEQMQKERDHFETQYKFQTQVNAELKNLLVASVGEDLQTRVNVLTEDKLQLARALLDTANNLSTHTEQIEFLAGQCEVWRSKFLASSVMVEELARWKADLTQKNQMLNEATKNLLHCVHQLRENQLEMLRNLKFLSKIRYLNLPATDVLTISAENLNILQQMVLHTGLGMPEGNLNISSANTNPLSDAEKHAIKALEFINQPLMATDDAIRALFYQTQRSFGMANDEQAISIEMDPSATDYNKN